MGQGSAARTVSVQLNEWITEGRLLPGAKVSDSAVAAELEVSRNTVREAFRLLAHDGLLVHEFNRGVFVPLVTSADVRDVYWLRGVIEPGVVRSLTPPDIHRLGPLQAAVDEARQAGRRRDWPAAGTANMHFHRSLVALSGSPRLDVMMRRLMAELRLLFAVIDNPRYLYQPFVKRNHELLTLMSKGRFEEGAEFLEDYLADSEGAILVAFQEKERSA
ncbi:GntR family transcriptional regulator [Ornithinimicrobium cryptoxanthini]|uniref:GntR family transcriptional regulator n=1 Tax=Ornithinimicrobium cryptoxanthini TaxID=2934161 RepID=A0ABY4YJ44_9MICO|nr:GntR family transcriptional regulator [Ornithinimicrobium cryptoxanthini]USQ76551.1 GntR family transcriptional regulator [Ornithinimicrobium cryptoxanthini]